MYKINLEEMVTLPAVVAGNATYATSTGNGRLLYGNSGIATREEFIAKIGKQLLPFFQANNLGNGIRVINSKEYLCPSLRTHKENVLKMNEIVDRLIAGESHIAYNNITMGGDQIA